MLEKADSFARQNKYDNIYLHTSNEDNEETLSFSKKNGYTRIKYTDQPKALTKADLPPDYPILHKKVSRDDTTRI
jgi:hypothetical protein